MKTNTFERTIPAVALGFSLLLGFSTAFAQPHADASTVGDPARWTQEDVTPAQKLRTARKEAVNAQKQSLDDCKTVDSARYAECKSEAHTNYQNDMNDIKNKFGV